MDTQKALDAILVFMEKAGALALANQKTAASHFKADNSIVTETDLAISKMAHEHFAEWLNLPNHILIDEESIDEIGTPAEVFANSEYQWVLDPIDGTATYVAGLDGWGILFALLHNQKPIIGCMYFPAQAKLFFSIGNEFSEISNPFTVDEEKKPVEFVDRGFNKQSLFTIQHKEQYYFKNYPQEYPCIIVSAWTPMEMILPLKGQTVGKFGKDAVWDYAATVAFSQHSPVKLWRVYEGTEVNSIEPADLSDNWKWKEPYLEATPKNFAILKESIKDKGAL